MTIDFKAIYYKQRPLGKGGHIYTPRKTVEYENLIKGHTQANTQTLFERIYRYMLIFVFANNSKTATKALEIRRGLEVFPPQARSIIIKAYLTHNGVVIMMIVKSLH